MFHKRSTTRARCKRGSEMYEGVCGVEVGVDFRQIISKRKLGEWSRGHFTDEA